jgi:hypothetical protein
MSQNILLYIFQENQIWEKNVQRERFQWKFKSYLRSMTGFCSIYHHVSTAWLTQ